MDDFPKTIPELAESLAVPTQELLFFANSINRNILVTKRPKPNGGVRTITAPSRKLKALLKRLDLFVLRRIPLHPLLFHRPGSSYLEMIKIHQKSNFIITADIDDFYPNVKPHAISIQLISQGVDRKLAKTITRLTTANHSLPQGFPTSPTIAAIVLNPVLVRLKGLAKTARLRIGIYADNLAISADFDLKRLQNTVKKIFLQQGFQLDKWQGVDRYQRQEIMNIVVNDGLSVRPEYRRDLRRQIFILSKVPDHFSTTYINMQKTVRGKLMHVYQVNKSQFESLSKYATELGLKV